MNKTVFIAGLIGLVFGFLFSATLGVNFFPEDGPDNGPMNEVDGATLKKDEEAFRVAYNLTESIYIPITGEMAEQMINDGDTFILYSGRDTCPYCQQFVPVLMEAAENLDIDMIYHIDTTDSLNSDFVDDYNAVVTPTTFVVKDGVIVETIIGYRNLNDTETLVGDALN